MKVDTKRKVFYWVFKVCSVLVSCLLPIWAVCEKFPVWKMYNTTGRSVGVGSILILIVITIVFRKTVFEFIKDKLNIKHAPPIAVWFVMLIVAYILQYIARFMADLITVLWMGVIGCVLGTMLTFMGECLLRKKDNGNDGNGNQS